MRPIGFSTGALAYGDFQRGIGILRNKRISVVELSALRVSELAPLVEALDALDLSGFTYVSVHAPSKYEATGEREIIELLRKVVDRGWPVVLHPDTIHDFSAWEGFGNLLFIENMDKRNSTGRTAVELSRVFAKLPRASLCFDLGHCRQVDPTMNESYLILQGFRTRLKQLHVSEVNSRSTHDPLSRFSIGAFEKIAHLIPADVPVIMESPVGEKEVEVEIARARAALPLTTNHKSRKRDVRCTQATAF